MSDKKPTGLVIPVVLLILIFVLFRSACTDPASERLSTATTQNRETSIRNALQYLTKEVKEIAWIDVTDNNVYIGFSTPPSDYQMVIRGAALRCNKTINFGCHVWAVDSRDRPFTPGKGRYFGEVTARDGRVQ